MRYLAATLLIFLPLPAHAQEPQDGRSLSVKSDFQHFDYREFSDQGKLLDQENGFLPGWLLGLDYSRDSWQIAGQLSYHAGGIAYAGQTNGGVATVSTTTEQRIIDAELNVGYRFQRERQIRPTLYLGVANRSWRRDIQPTYTASGTPVRGLLENYRWWQAFLGAKISAHKISFIDWGLDARLVRIITPRIEVDYSGQYDNSKLDLGSRWGFRLALPVSYSMSYSTTLEIEPYWEKYELGRSSSAELINQGVIKGVVFEPDSIGRNYGVMFGIRTQY